MPVTRLAPSPTGALHLGNARTFLINWILAKQNQWRIVLRIEDLDGPRIRRGADRLVLDDLSWLGISWDEGPVYQSSRLQTYRSAIARLIESGHAYPCVCTRREAALAASAPHADDGATVYPGTCRDRFRTIDAARAFAGREPAIRFRMPDQIVEYTDQFAGAQRYDALRQLGDFVIAKSDGTAAYQLAVVVDDADASVSEIVRGDDLLDSTPRQILLYRALGGGERIPRYRHVPLVVGPDGKRLAKRHGDTRIVAYRDAGVSAGRVLALLARWLGIDAGMEMATPDELVQRFDLAKLSREKIVMTAADDRWLRQAAR